MTDIIPPENTEFLIHIMSGAHKQSSLYTTKIDNSLK